MFKKKLGFLAGVMVLLSLAGYFVCLMAGGSKQVNKEEFLLVTSFYPMYILAENLTEGVEGVTVANLTENQTGCLHEYQLTSADMKLLSRADAFLINGAGMELFMEKVLENTSGLQIIEASHGISLLEGVHHDHSHENHDAHNHSENGHVWMDVECYRQQAVTVKEALQRLLPDQKEELDKAAANYDLKLQELTRDVEELKEYTRGTPVVVFHEGFAYLAESLGMEVLWSLSLDEETLPSAGEIAEVIEEIKYHGGAHIFIEQDYADYVKKILVETDATAFYLDPLTTGDGNPDSYYEGMRKNLGVLYSIKGNQ